MRLKTIHIKDVQKVHQHRLDIVARLQNVILENRQLTERSRRGPRRLNLINWDIVQTGKTINSVYYCKFLDPFDEFIIKKDLQIKKIFH